MEADSIDQLHIRLRDREQRWLEERAAFLDRFGKEPVDTFKGFYLVMFVLMTILLSALPCLSWASGHRDFAKSLLISLGIFGWISFWMIYGKIQFHQFVAAKAEFEAERAEIEKELDTKRGSVRREATV